MLTGSIQERLPRKTAEGRRKARSAWARNFHYFDKRSLDQRAWFTRSPAWISSTHVIMAGAVNPEVSNLMIQQSGPVRINRRFTDIVLINAWMSACAINE